jgi:hypothetical protein
MSHSWKFRVVISWIVALIVGATYAGAQSLTTGQVAGTVTDSSGAAVTNAAVTLKSVDKGNSQGAKTNSSGAYQFSLLAPGKYSVTVDVTGFQNVTRATEVNVGRISTVDISLSIGNASETVTVTEQIPLINQQNGDVGTTISEIEVQEVPNPGNDITYSAQVAPGVVANTTGGQGNFASNGISATANLFTIDGMDNNDPYLSLNNSGATNLTLGQNEVQVVAVVTNGYSGEYAGLAGANVNYITRSGTNDFHGRAIWYWNGSTLNANTFLNKAQLGGQPVTPKSFVNDNQWGGDFGGPIVKNKLFGYFNTEGLRVLIPTSATVQIPTPEFAVATIANLTSKGLTKSIPFYQSMFDLYKNAPGAQRAAPGVFGGGTGCDSLPRIPAGVTNCVENFQSNISNLTHDALYTGRVDYNLTDKDRAFLRINYEHGFQAGFTDPINPAFNLISDQPAWQGQLNETHTFSNAVNQFILSGQWYQAQFTTPSLAKSLAAFPTTLTLGDSSLTGLGGLDRIVPQGRNVTQYQISDDYSRPVNNHVLKFGLKFRRNDVTDFNYGQLTSGQLIPSNLNAFFNGGFGPSKADPTVNDFTQYQQNFPTRGSQPFAFYTIGGYAQDEWRIKSNFALTLALRVDHVSNPVCQTNCFAETVVPFAELNHSASIPYNQAIRLGDHQALRSFTNLQWQPRLSFAWSPLGRGRSTVVRGGIGIFYDQFPGNVVDPYSSNLPVLNGFQVGTPNGNLTLAPTEDNNVFAAAVASNNGLVNGFAAGQTLAQIQAAVPAFSPPAIASSDRKNIAPQYQKWSLGIEEGFGPNTSLSVMYVGNHGIHELVVNSLANAFGANYAGLPTQAIDPRFGPVVLFQSRAISNYNGLQTSIRHRFGRAGTFQANYTWSHALDLVSNGGLVQFSNTGFGSTNSSIPGLLDPNNPRRNYGNADYDVRHYFSASYVYEIPFKTLFHEHGPSALLNGWEVAGTVFARSGLPFTITDGTTAASLTNFGSGLFPAFALGNVNGPRSTSCSKRTLTCLDKNQFSRSSNGFGNATRNSFFGPSFFDTDFAITKRTHIPGWERGELGIGAQFYNLFNHANFDAPVSDISSGQFGKLIRTVSSPTSIYGSGLGANASPRLVQFKLQLQF